MQLGHSAQIPSLKGREFPTRRQNHTGTPWVTPRSSSSVSWARVQPEPDLPVSPLLPLPLPTSPHFFPSLREGWSGALGHLPHPPASERVEIRRRWFIYCWLPSRENSACPRPRALDLRAPPAHHTHKSRRRRRGRAQTAPCQAGAHLPRSPSPVHAPRCPRTGPTLHPGGSSQRAARRRRGPSERSADKALPAFPRWNRGLSPQQGRAVRSRLPGAAFLASRTVT